MSVWWTPVHVKGDRALIYRDRLSVVPLAYKTGLLGACAIILDLLGHRFECGVLDCRAWPEHVDHDHHTDYVRDILCPAHNYFRTEEIPGDYFEPGVTEEYALRGDDEYEALRGQ